MGIWTPGIALYQVALTGSDMLRSTCRMENALPARILASGAVLPGFVVALVVIWLASFPEESHACSCAYPYTPSGALDRSAAVFAGKVVSIEGSAVNRMGMYPITVEFEVSTVWKGPGQGTMRMRTPGINNSCHFPFQEGVEYLVYSLNGSNVDWCSPVRPLSESADDLAELGEGQVLAQAETATTPVPKATEQPTGRACGPSQHADPLPLLGLLFGIAWFALRRQRSG